MGSHTSKNITGLKIDRGGSNSPKKPVNDRKQSDSKNNNTAIKKNSPNKKSLTNSKRDIPKLDNKVLNVRDSHKHKNVIDITEINTEINSVLKLQKEKNPNLDNFDLINTSFDKHYYLCNIEKDYRIEIIKQMSLYSVTSTTTIFEQGSNGTLLFIILEGEVDVLVNNEIVNRLKKGDSFGELSLIHSAPRSATAVSITNCEFWCIGRKIFKDILIKMTNISYSKNLDFINAVPILNNLDNNDKTNLCSKLNKYTYESKSFICKKGDIADCLYIIKEGNVEVINQDNKGVVRTLSKGDHFGKNSLILDVCRKFNVVAKTKCEIVSISKESLKMIIGEHYREMITLNWIKMILGRSKKYGTMEVNEIDRFISDFNIKSYDKNQMIMKTGDKTQEFINIILEGNVVQSKTKEIMAKRGDVLFDSIKEDRLKYDLIADPDLLVASIPTDVFNKKMEKKGSISSNGGSSKSTKSTITTESNGGDGSPLINSLKRINLFKHFSDQKLNEISELIKVEIFNSGNKLVKQGETKIRKLFIVKKGKADCFVDSTSSKSLKINDSFGELPFINNNPYPATVNSSGSTEFYTLEWNDKFKNIVNPLLMDFITKRAVLPDDSIDLKDLEYIRTLGSGTYGIVHLTKSKKNKNLYAIKSICKNQIFFDRMPKSLESERESLMLFDHPFIMKYFKTLKSKSFIFFVLEYLQGRELFEIIRDIGLLSHDQCQFYIGQILLGLETMHEKNIIHRDVKPENIIACDNGYIKIIDYGTVKKVTDRTRSIVGTPHYMAPEVILGEGYTYSVDIWSMAIIMYELVCGGVPFGESTQDMMEIYKDILKGNVKFPDDIKDKNYKNILTQMLNKNITVRLQMFSQIKTHAYFENLSWDKLLSFDIDPPYKDITKQQSDFSVKETFLNFSKNLKTFVPSEKQEKNKETIAKSFDYEKWFNEF